MKAIIQGYSNDKWFRNQDHSRLCHELLTLLFKVVPAKVKYETLGEMVHVPLATPERRLRTLHLMSRIFSRLSSDQIPCLYRVDFTEPMEPVMEPEATFLWKGEGGGGLKLDKVSIETPIFPSCQSYANLR